MPVNYQVPNWIHGADPAQNYAKGFSLGLQGGQAQAHIAMERARLNHDATRQALAFTLEQQKAERESMVEQQKLEVAKAYHQQQTELKAQELEQKEAMLQQKIKEAAARQMVMDRYRQAISNNEDPVRATLGLAGMTGTAGPVSKALGLIDERNNPQLHEPQIKQLPDGTSIAWNPGNKNFAITRIPSDKGNQIPLKDLYVQSLKTAQELSMHIDPTTGKKDPMYGTLEKSLNELQDMIQARQKIGGGSEQDLPSDWTVLPWPKKETELQKGRLYDTPARGIMYYDKGGKWTRPMSPAVHQNQLSMAGDEEQPEAEIADTEDVPEEETDTEMA